MQQKRWVLRSIDGSQRSRAKHHYGAAMDAHDDIVESAKPPKPPKPHDAERRTSFLLHAVAVAAVATAAFTGITAWETHQDRITTKTIYCSSFAYNPEPDSQQEQLSDQLGC